MLTPGPYPILDFDDDPEDLTSSMMLADVEGDGPDVAVLAFLSERVIETTKGWGFVGPARCRSSPSNIRSTS